MPEACPWLGHRVRCAFGSVLPRRPVRAAIVVIGLAAGSTSTSQAQTVNDFDNPGTPYDPRSCVQPPNFVPAVMPGGPTGNFLRLASSPAPNSNTISFHETNTGIFPIIVADFDFRITPTNGRADGLGFALLNTAHYPAGGVCPELPPFVPDEPNFTNSLGIGFDVYHSIHPGNSGADVNNNHVSIQFDATEQAEFDVPLVDLGSGRWIHAQIIFRQGVNVTVVLTPQGGQPVIVADRSLTFGAHEARVLLGARSGGQTGDHDIDNVRVQFLDASATLLSFATNYRPGETDSSALVTVTRAGNTSGSVQVQYTTADGTAHAGLDYTSAAGTLSFGPGDTSKSFQLSIINDNVNEGDEHFFLNLSDPSAGAVIIGPPATITIVDDERAREAGVWGSIFGTEVVAVHLHHLLDGTVLFWSGAGGEGTEHVFENPRIWNPATGSIETVPFPHNLFCSGHAFLQDAGCW